MAVMQRSATTNHSMHSNCNRTNRSMDDKKRSV